METLSSSEPDYPEIILKISQNSQRHKIKQFSCNLEKEEKENGNEKLPYHHELSQPSNHLRKGKYHIIFLLNLEIIEWERERRDRPIPILTYLYPSFESPVEIKASAAETGLLVINHSLIFEWWSKKRLSGQIYRFL